MDASAVSEFIVDDVRSIPLMTSRDVIHSMKEKYGMDISYNDAWESTHMARNLVFGN